MKTYQIVLFILVIILVFLLNVTPTFKIGYYQDDYRSYLDVTQYLNGNVIGTITDNPLNAGFRPLMWFERVAFFELFGENYFAHRFFLSLIHFMYGIILVLFIRLKDTSLFTSLFTLFLYFSMIFTRQTIYSSVAFTPSDLITLIIIYLSFFIIIKQKFNYGLIAIITLLYIVALGHRENVIVLSGLIPGIFVWHYKIVPKKLLLTVCASFIFLGILYLYLYSMQSESIERQSLNSVSLKMDNLIAPIIGTGLSSIAPVYNLYNTLRGSWEWSMITSIFITCVPFLLSGFLLFTQNGKLFFQTYYKDIFQGFAALVLISGLLLSPYILNNYFEPRMMVVTFALSILFWSFWLSKLLQSTYIEKSTPFFISIFIVLSLVVFSVGRPVSEDIDDSYKVAQKFIKITKQLKQEGIDKVRLVDFPTKGGYLRKGNAKGVIDYISKRSIEVELFENVEDVPTGIIDYPTVFYLNNPAAPFKIEN